MPELFIARLEERVELLRFLKTGVKQIIFHLNTFQVQIKMFNFVSAVLFEDKKQKIKELGRR